MKSDKLKSAIIITVILFLIGAIISITIINKPDMFRFLFSTELGDGFISVDSEGLGSLNSTIRLIGYSFMATSLIYSAIIFYKWLSQ